MCVGDSPLDVVQSYTAFAGRMQPLPGWVGSGAILGLQGGTGAVLEAVGQVGRVWGNLSDVAGVWLQDWTGQRSFNGSQDLPRVGLWWNWEVRARSLVRLTAVPCAGGLHALPQLDWTGGQPAVAGHTNADLRQLHAE